MCSVFVKVYFPHKVLYQKSVFATIEVSYFRNEVALWKKDYVSFAHSMQNHKFSSIFLISFLCGSYIFIIF